MNSAYNLISADSHVNEPPELWLERVPAKFRGRAPRMISLEQGDAWILEGAMAPVNFGLNQCAGIPNERRSPWVRWEQVQRGGYEPRQRVKDQETDGVDAEFMYPTPRIAGAIFWNRTDKEFHLACVRAYNDWMSEFCAVAPERLLGLAMLPNVGVDEALVELRRAMKLPGIKGVLLGQFPAGGLVLDRANDKFWAEAESSELPLAVHVGFATEPPGHALTGSFVGEFRFMDAPQRVFQFIYGGLFQRFPKLQFVFAETDAAWVPLVAEQMDNVWSRGVRKPADQPPEPPSAYFKRNFNWVFVNDTAGIKFRHEIGVDNMLWSSDHPHSFSNWPKSREVIERQFAGVPAEEREKMLAGNARRLYRL